MTIILTKPVRVGGVELAAATTQTFAADVEADLVSRASAAYTINPTIGQGGVPVMADINNLTGGIELSVADAKLAVDKLTGKVPVDYEIMFARPVGQLTKVSVPNPYSAPPIASLHPGPLYVPKTFCGYTHLMAYTPMNASDSQWENPCICASNDPEKDGWELPSGAPNPLWPKPLGAGYNSDTHLFMVSPSVLGLLFRARNVGTPSKNRLYISTTTDLVNWTVPVEIWSGLTGSSDLASPSIFYDPTIEKWVIFGHNLDVVNRDFCKITSSDLLSGWDTSPTVVNFPIPAAGRKWWHSWFTRLESGRIVGFAMDNNGTVGNAGYIYVAQSYDNGANFESCWIKGESTTELYYRAAGWFVEHNGVVDARIIYSYISSPYMVVQKLELRGSTTKSAEFERMGGLLAIAGKMKSRGLLLADDFNRADSVAGLGTSLDGKTWVTDTEPNHVGILSGMTYPVTTGNCISLVDIGARGYSVMAVIGAISGVPAYVVMNFQDNAKFIRVGNTASRLTIQKYYNTLIWQKTFDSASGSDIIFPVAGDIIRIDVSGQSAKFYLNGELKHTTNGDLIDGMTKVGIQCSGATYSQWDGFVVSQF